MLSHSYTSLCMSTSCRAWISYIQGLIWLSCHWSVFTTKSSEQAINRLKVNKVHESQTNSMYYHCTFQGFKYVKSIYIGGFRFSIGLGYACPICCIDSLWAWCEMSLEVKHTVPPLSLHFLSTMFVSTIWSLWWREVKIFAIISCHILVMFSTKGGSCCTATF